MTMITCGRETVLRLNLLVVSKNTSGVPTAADAAPVASFYRVDPATGTLALDILVGTSGQITMTALGGNTGVYSCPVLVSTMQHAQYQVIVNWAVSASARNEVIGILFNEAYDVIMRDSVSPTTSVVFSTVTS